MANRWVKLYASTVTDAIFNDRDSDTLKVWIWILISTFYKPTTIFIGNQEVDFSPGQMPFGRKAASVRLGLDENKVYRIVKKLERKGCIRITSTNKYSIITVTNWSRYQNVWYEDVDNLVDNSVDNCADKYDDDCESDYEAYSVDKYVDNPVDNYVDNCCDAIYIGDSK